MTTKRKILAITPICCTIAYLLIGFLIGGSAWGYGITVYLLVPLMPYLIGLKKIVISVTLVITCIYVFGCLIAMHFGLNIWHPAWVIFLLIPIIHILKVPSKKDEGKEKKETVVVEEVDDEDKVYEAK